MAKRRCGNPPTEQGRSSPSDANDYIQVPILARSDPRHARIVQELDRGPIQISRLSNPSG